VWGRRRFRAATSSPDGALLEVGRAFEDREARSRAKLSRVVAVGLYVLAASYVGLALTRFYSDHNARLDQLGL